MMMLVIAVLLIGVIVLVAALSTAVLRGRWRSSRTQFVGRKQRLSGADPYASQRTPDKLNPGLGGCASGGGC